MGATRVTVTLTNPANGKSADALFLVDTDADHLMVPPRCSNPSS